jgi:hypothetical protein
VFPSIWVAVESFFKETSVFSCEEVYLEIKEQEDDLSEWADDDKKAFLQPTEEVNDEMSNVMSRFPNLAAKGASLNRADPWVLSVARVSGAVVVTDEQPDGNRRATLPPKLPNACEALSIAWIRPIDFLAEMKIKF